MARKARSDMNEIQVPLCCEQGPRDNLEDASGVLKISIPVPLKTDITIALVADGVGGNSYGEIASNEAVSSIKHLMASSLAVRTAGRCITPGALQDLLRQQLTTTNDLILCLIESDPSLKGMSTTVVCAVITDGILHVGWAGDSRSYHYRRRKLRLLTTDHSEAQCLVDKGLLDKKYAKSHPLSHMINQYLGMANDFKPETTMTDLCPGDIVIVTSDGLTDVISDDVIASSIRKYLNGDFSFQRLPQYLTELALTAGSTDNVTVLCCEYMPEQAPEFRLFDSTLTGAYPVELAEVFENLGKEF